MKQLFSDVYLILTLDCEGSARLASDSLDRRLRWSENAAAKIHRLICGKSRKLDRQLVEMNGALEENLDAELSPEARARIRQAIDK